MEITEILYVPGEHVKIIYIVHGIFETNVCLLQTKCQAKWTNSNATCFRMRNTNDKANMIWLWNTLTLQF